MVARAIYCGSAWVQEDDCNWGGGGGGGVEANPFILVRVMLKNNDKKNGSVR